MMLSTRQIVATGFGMYGIAEMMYELFIVCGALSVSSSVVAASITAERSSITSPPSNAKDVCSRRTRRRLATFRRIMAMSPCAAYCWRAARIASSSGGLCLGGGRGDRGDVTSSEYDPRRPEFNDHHDCRRCSSGTDNISAYYTKIVI